MKIPVYLDHHATTPIDPRVLDVMVVCLQTEFGNASSAAHVFGQRAEALVARARRQVAALIGAEPQEIIFTGSTTESNNLALKGISEMYREKGSHLVSQVTEHKSVLAPLEDLGKKGMKTTFLGVDSTGRLRIEELEKVLTDETLLVSVMLANNEIGTLQPVEEIGKIAKARGILFHVDGAQAVGKIPVDVKRMGVDLLSFSAHKMYGPKGIGALYIRSQNPRVRLAPLLHGGGQELGLRSGTLDVPAIVGFAKACEIAGAEMAEESVRVRALRDRLQKGILERLPDVFVNGHPVERLPNNLNLSFSYIETQTLLQELCREVAVSSGSACSTADGGTSHVLKALGVGPQRVHGSVRFGLGRFNTTEEIDFAVKKVVSVVETLRRDSPLYRSLKEHSGRGE